MAYLWKRLVIEKHVKIFDGISEEEVTSASYTPEELTYEGSLVIKGKSVPDYFLNVQNVNENGVVFFENLRSDNPLMFFTPYESRGVIILHLGDIHKTPEDKLSYNKSYWYALHIEE